MTYKTKCRSVSLYAGFLTVLSTDACFLEIIYFSFDGISEIWVCFRSLAIHIAFETPHTNKHKDKQ